MSSGLGRDISIYTTIAPEIDINEKKKLAVLESALHTTRRYFTSNNYSTTSIYWNLQPPDDKTVMNRRVLMRVPFRVVANSGSFVPGLYDAPRFMALSSVINSATFSLNGNSVSINLQECLVPLARCMSSQEQMGMQFSTSPSQMDQYAEYSNGLGVGGLGQARNVFSFFGESFGVVPSRGSFPVVYSSGNTVADFTVEEPLLLSPCRFNDESTPGFCNLESCDLTINFGNIQKVWSHDAVNGNSISGLTVTIPSPPIVDVTYYTLPASMVPPRSLSYDLSKVTRFPTAYGAVTAGQTVTIPGGSTTINSIPKKLIFFAMQTLADQTFSSSDTFCRINSFNLQWANQSALFSNASPQQLYNMTKKNGYAYSWIDWYAQSGGVLAVCPGADFDIDYDSGDAPGIVKQVQVQWTLSVTSLWNTTKNVTGYMITIEEGSVTLEGGNAIIVSATLTADDVRASKSYPRIAYSEVYRPHKGGDFLGSLKSFFSNVGDKVSSAARAVAPYALPIIQRGAQTLLNKYLPGGAMHKKKSHKKKGGMKKKKAHRRKGRGEDDGKEENSDSESESCSENSQMEDHRDEKEERTDLSKPNFNRLVTQS